MLAFRLWRNGRAQEARVIGLNNKRLLRRRVQNLKREAKCGESPKKHKEMAKTKIDKKIVWKYEGHSGDSDEVKLACAYSAWPSAIGASLL